MFVADMDEVTVYSEMRKKHTKKRKRPSYSDGSEQNKPRKKQPKLEVVSSSSEPMILYPETQINSITGSSIDINPVIKKVRIKRVKKVKLQNQEDRLQTDVKLQGDEKFFNEAGNFTGKYDSTFAACLMFILKAI